MWVRGESLFKTGDHLLWQLQQEPAGIQISHDMKASAVLMTMIWTATSFQDMATQRMIIAACTWQSWFMTAWHPACTSVTTAKVGSGVDTIFAATSVALCHLARGARHRVG